MRDKIAEIIRNARMNANPLAQLGCAEADALIANGVILPPCKVGTTVYRVVEMSTGVDKIIKRTLCPPYKCDVIKECKPTIKRFIRTVEVTKNNYFDVLENFGKTVFLTKEEAEKALKEKENDNNT